MNKSKIFMIVSFITLIISIIGSVGTYAWYLWSSSENQKTLVTTSIGATTIYYDAGTSISASLIPIADKENGIVKTIEVKSSTESNLKFNLYLDVDILDAGLKHESFRYQIYRGEELVTEGNFSDNYLNNIDDPTKPRLVSCEYNNTNHIVLLSEEPVSTTKTTYTLYIWIDGLNYSNPNGMQNAEYSFNLHAEGEGAIIKEGVIPDITEIPEQQHKSLAYKILSDYYFAEKSEVTNNDVKYYYDTEHNLMSDIGGNVRYYGATPNNYIYFNCSDYSNQTADTCELWRIIGVFEGKVKIIRNSIIGTYSWDNKTNGIGSATDTSGQGSNDWSDSRLMMLLNPEYDVDKFDASNNLLNEHNRSYYYNSIGTSSSPVQCYSGSSNKTKDCYFDGTGLKNDTTKNLISKTLWYLRGWDSASVYSDQMYEYERTTGKVYNTTRPITWTGKVALAYPSDYGYAADFGSCNVVLSSYYNNTLCTRTNWMKPIFVMNSYGWLLTPNFSSASHAWRVYSNGQLVSYPASNPNGVAPVLHLNSELSTKAGDGSQNTPYQLDV